jgi:hypothetical protein
MVLKNLIGLLMKVRVRNLRVIGSPLFFMRNPNHSQTFHIYVRTFLNEKKFYPSARLCWNNFKKKYEIVYYFTMPSTFEKAGYTILDSINPNYFILQNDLKAY